MYYVYLLQSQSHPAQQYIGLTRDLRRRLAQHNNATSPHTKKFCPWGLLAYFAFKSEATASAFERYLKSGSGRVFVKRHFRVSEAGRKRLAG
jgi:predicted GIY-YIG superfamily endonuclease